MQAISEPDTVHLSMTHIIKPVGKLLRLLDLLVLAQSLARMEEIIKVCFDGKRGRQQLVQEFDHLHHFWPLGRVLTPAANCHVPQGVR